ncbi:NYN domain protein [mine drainage metagenome]|uniref:NYN domain protein n=1 Tax=mine drainage metagenome TaxID=410659 RepID=A0A1J5S475_9ZZZZ
MNRLAIFVDAGYFFAASAQAIKGRQVPRRHLSITSPDRLIQDLFNQASSLAGNAPLLRAYWYDAVQGPRPSLEQTILAHLPGVKLRLGTLNSAGEQKGVDSLIVTDLIELARNKAIADAILVSGDEDLRVAVQLAQTFGVRVHVLAVGDASKNVSAALQMESDSVGTLTPEWLAQRITINEPTTVQRPTASATACIEVARTAPTASSDKSQTPSFDEAVRAIAEELLSDAHSQAINNLVAHFKTNQTVPPEFDRKLIAKTAAALNRQLTGDEKRGARGIFVTVVRSKVSS